MCVATVMKYGGTHRQAQQAQQNKKYCRNLGFWKTKPTKHSQSNIWKKLVTKVMGAILGASGIIWKHQEAAEAIFRPVKASASICSRWEGAREHPQHQQAQQQNKNYCRNRRFWQKLNQQKTARATFPKNGLQRLWGPSLGAQLVPKVLPKIWGRGRENTPNTSKHNNKTRTTAGTVGFDKN